MSGKEANGCEPHVWRTDKQMGYAEHERQWCKNCGLVRNKKNETVACLGECHEMIVRRNRPTTPCRNKVAGIVDGNGYCSLHLKKHEFDKLRAWATPLLGELTDKNLETLFEIVEEAARRAGVTPQYRSNKQ